jgi:hypothetical protein
LEQLIEAALPTDEDTQRVRAVATTGLFGYMHVRAQLASGMSKFFGKE